MESGATLPRPTRFRQNEPPMNMRTAKFISFAMTILGIALVVIGAAFGSSPLVTLTGMLMFVAGIVKVGMVAIWSSFFAHPVANSRHSSAPTPTTEGIHHD